MNLPDYNFTALTPALILSLWAILILLVDLLFGERIQRWLSWLTVAGLLVTGASALSLWNVRAEGFSGMVVLDNFAIVVTVIAMIAGILAVLLSSDYLVDRDLFRPEYFALMLFSITGILLLASGRNLIMLFLGLELLSIPLYVLTGFARPDVQSEEAAMKYFLLGALASSFLVYGIALTYGATGSTDLLKIRDALQNVQVITSTLTLGGLILILVGFGFKVAAVPFHMWTPDVYQGAPTPITAYMSVGAKAGGFAALLRIMYVAFPQIASYWTGALVLLAIATLVVGNLLAIQQSSLKRLLAYSSIAHAGYILVGLAAGNNRGVAGALFYLLAYAFTNLGAFGIMIALSKKGEEADSIESYAGLSSRQPWLALAMTVFMLSLTGVPLTAGLVGKIFVFSAAAEAGLWTLLIVAVLTSVISAFYYLRLVVLMYMRDPINDFGTQVHLTPGVRTALALAVIGTVLLGIIPGNLIDFTNQTLAITTQTLVALVH
ncbi:MAG: NADH-quinone oxidoreductase subunit N [Chloroflexi bacterium]|nr:NADH-quinone oxidoreductase subunit N [Chloroflexota bacterium]